MPRTSAAVLSALMITAPLAWAGTSSFESAAVKPADIPPPVMTAHQAKYKGASSTWKRNSWSNDKGAKSTVYVAWFSLDKKLTRAAYTEAGEGYLTITYLGGAAGLPAPIKDKVLARNAGFTISGAQRYEAPTANMSAFRVELAKGATRVVTWSDKDGNELSKDNLPDAAEELGG